MKISYPQDVVIPCANSPRVLNLSLPETKRFPRATLWGTTAYRVKENTPILKMSSPRLLWLTSAVIKASGSLRPGVRRNKDDNASRWNNFADESLALFVVPDHDGPHNVSLGFSSGEFFDLDLHGVETLIDALMWARIHIKERLDRE